jgi:hypothetical protein
MQGDLAIHRPVAGDVACLRRERQRQQALRQVFGGGDAGGGGNGAATCAQFAPHGVAKDAHRKKTSSAVTMRAKRP